MFVVDTNVLVYAANVDSPEHEACRERLDRWRRRATPWYLTWHIVYEFLRVVTHPAVLEHPCTVADAWEFARALLDAPPVAVLVATERHPDVLASLVEEMPELRGNLVHDGHTAVLMREHGIGEIVTRDADLRRFPFLTVTDPLEA